ncbi:type II secretion system ATPase GspE [Thioalkalivibrio sp. ALE19]|uniref:type II secretion system ATPase GspE n=1 Tax=Thioalkalivibrio sp. ALE19 TaxID=1266909 RepID=UPI000417C972|nr:type II secretion system ATPase GspE [Thioalkalivibrio sp. ALE19]
MTEALQGEAVRFGFAYARRMGVLPVGFDPEEGAEQVWATASADPEGILEVKRRSIRPVSVVQVDDEAFEKRLHEEHQSTTTQAMGEGASIEDTFGLDLSSVAADLEQPQDLLESEDDAPIIRLINALLTEAVRENASDIHIEPFERELVVRMRVDGVMRRVYAPSASLTPLIVSRVKVMADLDIAEKRLPQDGRISLRVAGRPVDVRVSTLPGAHGERVVMRLLDKTAGRLDLEHLGMDADTHDALERVVTRPHGIMLVTGPTGSGKTTTLYAALSRLNDDSRNILTVEDPIEYYLEGIGQTQINSRIDMTFARGLRAILRQDPDVVMVGEIRDLETVQIAVQASLTGHLVFSTLHTNTAVGAITRLRDMGVEPFLLSSTLNGILAQRLVRTLCPDCRRMEAASEREARLLEYDPSDPPVIGHPVGCEACHDTGYRGRSGVYELVEMDEELRALIHDNASEQTLTERARRNSRSLRDDARRLVLKGETSIEEMLRVTHEG